MHLNDEQILSPESSDELHLKQCSQCRERADNLLEMRQALKSLPVFSMPEDNWHEINRLYQLQLSEQKARSKLYFWRFNSFALAASLAAALFLFWPDSYEAPQQLLQKNQLADLITQNDLLQQRLNRQLLSNNLNSADFKQLQLDLRVVDKALQLAYIQKISNEEKAQLWQQRQRLIKKLLDVAEQPVKVRI